MGATSLEQYGERRSQAKEALRWVRACRLQIERWRETRRRTHDRDGRVNWDALEQGTIEGYFLVHAADRLRWVLAPDGKHKAATAEHADLLELLPPPQSVEGTPGERRTGAEYVRHVRNAHTYDDDATFESDYGFGHRWSSGNGDSQWDSAGGVFIGPLSDALDVMERQLVERLRERQAQNE